MNKSVFVAFVAICVSVLCASCGYTPKVEPIEGSNGFSTYTQKVDDRELMGVQNASGVSIRDARYTNVEYQKDYFIGTIAAYQSYELFDAQGKEVLPKIKKSVAAFSSNVTDSLQHFAIEEANTELRYWFFPSNGKIVGPQKAMYLYSPEHLIVYEKDGKYGVLNYDNKELVPLCSQLAFATRTDVKKVKQGKKFVRETVKTPIIYTGEKGKDDWKKFSAITGQPLGELDSQDADLINKSHDTMLDDVYAVREKK